MENKLGQFLRAFFWLPILLAGFVGFTFIEPSLHSYRMIGLGILGIFLFLILLQAFCERRTRSEWREAQRKTTETRITDTATSD